ncbi:PKD domain-containing protein, partial [Mariniflexile sp. HMF6888]|uniref:PKD domain-containing protein n=1 Tax=Mariniflexile sp. HMF6888 TaxID=3373086 RepID=UPI0037A9A96F
MKTITSNLLSKTSLQIKHYLFAFVFLFIGLLQVNADCTIDTAATGGDNVMTGAELVDYINTNNCTGTITITSGVDINITGDVTIPSVIDRIIIEDGGQIIWVNNGTLFLAPNTAIVIENTTDTDTQSGTGALTSGGPNCNNNKRINIGGIEYSACTGGGNVCIIFSEVIAAGGTIQIDPNFAVISGTDNQVCFVPTLIDVQLNGFVEGNPTYLWTVKSAPTGATVTFNPNNTVEDPTVTVSEPGTYIFNIEVTVSLSDECTDTFVTVNADIEIVFLEGLSATTMVITPGAGSTCNLNVDFTASTTNGGANLSYEWDFDDGSATSSLQNPSHTYASSGTYNVSLTVTDPDGLSPCNVVVVNKEVTITDNNPTITAPSPINIVGCDVSAITVDTARFPYDSDGSNDIKDSYITTGYTATDDGTITSIAYTDVLTSAANGCPQVTRTFTITDGCENTATAVQIINITAPDLIATAP